MGVLQNVKTLVCNPVVRNRYLRWQFTRTVRGRPPCVRLPKGKRVLPASRFSDYNAIATQHPGVPEFNVVDKLLTIAGGGLFVDVGANVGVMSVVAHSTNRSTSIVAFEPCHRYCSAWHANMVLNGVTDATLLQAAVGDRCSEVGFRMDPALPLNGKIDHGMVHFTERVEHVQMVTLDSICAAWQLDRIALSKIDVEGAEPLVIRGARDLLMRRQIKCILLEFIIEFMEDMDEDPYQFVRDLTDAGFVLHAICHDGAIGPRLDVRAVVDDRRVAAEAPPRPFHEINLAAVLQ